MECWTWKDTLSRIQYIDTIINHIVSNAILINTILFTLFAVLHYVLHNKEMINYSEIAIRCVNTIICLLGFSINLFLAKILARQEYIRKWYFENFPKSIPLIPSSEWLKTGDKINGLESNTKIDRIENIEKLEKRRWLLKLGDIGPGYCETWIYILFTFAVGFFVFACYNLLL
jgi:hypothetical protein